MTISLVTYHDYKFKSDSDEIRISQGTLSLIINIEKNM